MSNLRECFAQKLPRQHGRIVVVLESFRIAESRIQLDVKYLGIGERMIRMPLFCKLFSTVWVQNACIIGAKPISTQVFPLQFKTSPALWSEPLKKKKKLDPAIVRAREEKKKKRILKEIKKLEKLQRYLKPIAEFEIPNCLINELERRKRSVNVSEEVAEERILLLKKWSKFKFQQGCSDFNTLNRLVVAQQKALSELRLESEELYKAAVRIDPNLIPFKFIGPSETPAKEDYPPPDGTYIDVSKKWT